MYTTDQIRSAGIAGEINSSDVELLIKILEEGYSKGVDPNDFKGLLSLISEMCDWINNVGGRDYTFATKSYKEAFSKIAEKY